MLRACYRALRPGGRIAFTTLDLAEGLQGAERRRACEAAPRAAALRKPYPTLLASAGFSDISQRDLTPEYRATAAAWLRGWERHAEELAAIEGHDVVNERLTGWRDGIAAVDAGWVRRRMYAARRP